jgi:hypothetical protein
MASFNTALQIATLVSLGSLFGYTQWLMRTGRLSAHLTIRWLLAEGAAFLAMFFWSMLPFFSLEPGLDGRKHLIILVMILCVFIAFLILDSQARTAAHSHEIRQLTEEIALLRTTISDRDRAPSAIVATTSLLSRLIAAAKDNRQRQPISWSTVAGIFWISCCIAFYLLEMQPGLSPWLKAGLTASYGQ